MQSLMFLFRKNSDKAKAKPCCCVLYDDLGCDSRHLFDEDFPTSSSIRATVGHTVRGVKLGVDSTVECNPDGSVCASAKPEIFPIRNCRIAANVEGGADIRRGTLIAGVSKLPFLPGFAGELSVSNKTDFCRLKTEYRHKYFSVFSNNAFKENHDFSLGLDGVACCCPIGVAAGVSSKMTLTKVQSKELCGYAFSSINGRLSFVRGPWSLFLESTSFGKDYSLSVMRKMLMPHFTNEMIIAARLTAHAARPDLSAAKTWKEKVAAVNGALVPKATVAVRTQLTEFSSAKIKVDNKGMVGFSFSEQLSQWAHAVFAVNIDAAHPSKADNHKFAFTLTLMH